MKVEMDSEKGASEEKGASGDTTINVPVKVSTLSFH